MDKFVMMKKKNGTRVRTKDIWGVQIHERKVLYLLQQKADMLWCYAAWINAGRDLEAALRRTIC